MRKRFGKSVLAAALTFNLAIYGIPFPHAHAAEQTSMDRIPSTLSLSPELNHEESIISPNIDTNSAKTIKVIVQLKNQPVAVGEYASRMGITSFAAESTTRAIGKEQAAFLTKVKDLGIDMTVNYQFNTVLNGMEVSIPANQIPELAEFPEVKSIYENRVYYSIPVLSPEDAPSSDTVYYDITPLNQIGVPEVWNTGITGEGLKVGVIDTGVDYLHPDLAPAYIGGYDSINKDEDPYEDSADSEHGGSNHGTHVSGTISGQATNLTSEIVQKGVAYGADLYAYKVLGYNEEIGRATGSSAQVIDGIEHAVEDGMDVINLSLGSDYEKDPNTPDSIAINNAVLAGVVAVVANGNAADSGEYYYSMGSPASSHLGISVGAATSNTYSYTAETTSTLSPDPFSLNLVQWEFGKDNFDDIFGTDPIDAVYVGLGRSTDYEGLDVTGKIAFVSRGSNTFSDKFEQAKIHGAKAVIIFNGNAKIVDEVPVPDLDLIDNRDGYIGNHYGESFDAIPVFDMEGIKGRALAKSVLNDPSIPLQFSFSITKSVIPGDKMASFSSRGPMSDGNYSIKPDFVAPGVSIFSTLPAYGATDPNADYNTAYGRLSGTSMAAPHIAGLALLLKEAHPEWTPFDIRAALANTAEVMKESDDRLYDVYSQGAGRVHIARAIQTPAVLQTVEQLTILDKNLQPQNVTNYGDNASFGMMMAGDAPKAQPLQVKNFGNDTVTYTASIQMHPQVTSDPNPDKSIPTPDVNNIDVQLAGVDSENKITVGGLSTEPFTLEVAPLPGAENGVYEGEVVLESAGLPTLHLPFVVHVGERDLNNRLLLQDVTLFKRVIIPNGEEEQQRTDVSFYLNSDVVNYLALNIYSLNDEFIGTLREIYTEDSNGNLETIPRGLHHISDIDATYTDWNGVSDLHLIDGIYKLEIMAAQLDEDGIPVLNNDGSQISHTAYQTLGVSTLDGEVIRVIEAQKQLNATVTNTTILNQPVLTLPTAPDGITYEVTASSHPNFIGNDGVLLSLPQSGSADVDLTVTIASVANPTIKLYTAVTATLNAPVNPPGGGNSSGGGGGGMPNPSMEVKQTPSVPANDPTVMAVTNQGQFKTSVNVNTQTDKNHVLATIADTDLQTALHSSGNSPVAITLSVPVTATQEAQVNIPSSQVGMIAKANEGSTVIVGTGYSSVALPTSVLKNVSTQSDVQVTIHPADDQREIFSTQMPGSKVLSTPVSFEVDMVTGNERNPIAVSNQDFIKRSFRIDGKVDGDRAGVLFIEKGKVYPVAATITLNEDGTQIATVNRPGFSTYAVVSRDIRFTDIDTSWAKSAIQKLANKFLISGTSATTFAPKQNVTRAEFSALLTRALGLQSTASAPFQDVKSTDWFAKDVAAAYEAGLVSGVGNGNFNPHATISRQELAVMLARASELTKVPKKKAPSHHAYQDTQGFASYAKNSIHFVTENGLMSGKNTNGSISFDPTAPTSREAAASVLYRLLLNGNLIN